MRKQRSLNLAGHLLFSAETIMRASGMAIGYLASMDQQLDFLNQMKLKNTLGDGTAVRIEMKSVLLWSVSLRWSN